MSFLKMQSEMLLVLVGDLGLEIATHLRKSLLLTQILEPVEALHRTWFRQ